jgi:hypothetical protein
MHLASVCLEPERKQNDFKSIPFSSSSSPVSPRLVTSSPVTMNSSGNDSIINNNINNLDGGFFNKKGEDASSSSTDIECMGTVSGVRISLLEIIHKFNPSLVNAIAFNGSTPLVTNNNNNKERKKASKKAKKKHTYGSLCLHVCMCVSDLKIYFYIMEC